MKSSLLFLALTLACPAAFAQEKILPDDPSIPLFSRVSTRYRAVLEGVSFYYYTKADRLQILQEFFHSIESDYALLDLKKDVIGLDFEKLQRDALSVEAGIEEVGQPAEQALANLNFHDRIRKITAEFQDTHFSVRTKVTSNGTLIPFTVAEIDGKIVVVARYTKLMELFASEDEAFRKLEIGDEITAIDGRPVKEVRDSLLPYISASSSAYRATQATEALTFREFSLPTRPYAVVEIKHKDGSRRKLKFPWLYRQPARGDQAFYLKDRNFRRYDDLRREWNQDKKRWITKGIAQDKEEYYRTLPTLLEDKKFTDADETEVIIRTGNLIRQGRPYAVIQINSFSEAKVKRDGETVGFLEPIRAFVKETEEKQIPLLIDLRSNPGGNARFPLALLGILTEKDKSYGGFSAALPVTRYMQQLTDQFSSGDTLPEELQGLGSEESREIFYAALRAKAPYTDSYTYGDVTTDSEVGGFSQKIVALISPRCISACDITSALLKHSKRATLIGQAANGTGAGFLSSETLGTEWSDSHHVFRTRIPSFLFGRPGGEAGEHIFPGRTAELNMENKPIQPDVAYNDSMEDIEKNSSGWVKKALEELAK